MISPFVRRLRLAMELRALRDAAGLTHDQLAKQIGQSRQQISRLENGHVAPDQDDVMLILDKLGVDGDKWTQVLAIAQEAATKGWWVSTAKAMGERQAMFANLEAGATAVFQYQQTFVPGLAQTKAFTRHRIEAEWLPVPSDGPDPEGVLKGRAGRQRMLRRQGGPTYEAILDEVVVRRMSAPPGVLAAQMEHLAQLAKDENFTVRLLPMEARIEGYSLPACSFSFYRYPDPGDPTVVAVEAVTSDLILTEPTQTAAYVQMYDRLRGAARPVEESLRLITQVAARLHDHP